MAPLAPRVLRPPSLRAPAFAPLALAEVTPLALDAPSAEQRGEWVSRPLLTPCAPWEQEQIQRREGKLL